VREDGLYRHIRCSRPDTGCGSFDVITWPGYLAFVGDMGDFVFSRLPDMFNFFRGPDGRINPGYWAEKVKSKSCFGKGVEVFSVEKFHESVRYMARQTLDLEDGDDLPEDVIDELDALLRAEDEWECVSEVRNFSSDRFDFTDFFEYDNNEYTYHFIHCLRGIVWTINRYDEQKASAEK
jgi:hypothetical protein